MRKKNILEDAKLHVGFRALENSIVELKGASVAGNEKKSLVCVRTMFF